MRRALLHAAAAAGAAACLAGAAGCGGDGLPRQLTPGQRADLHTVVGQARTAAGGGDLAATRAALERFKARVRTLRDSGALEEDGAKELLKHAILADLKAQRAVAAPAATPPPVAPAPAVTPPPAAEPPPALEIPRGDERKPKGNGRDKGDKDDD